MGPTGVFSGLDDYAFSMTKQHSADQCGQTPDQQRPFFPEPDRFAVVQYDQMFFLWKIAVLAYQQFPEAAEDIPVQPSQIVSGCVAAVILEFGTVPP